MLSANYDSGDRVYDFTYDLAGNRLEEDLTGTGVTDKLTEFEYTDANQILRKRVDSGSWANFTYDNNGNLTDDGANSYEWDRANRLLEVDTGTPAELTAYAYDGLNNRISQAIGTTSPVVTQYLLDTQPALTKVIGATVGGNTDRFIHAPRGIHSVENSSDSWRYALQDGLGSVRAEVDNLVAVHASQSYAPYGEVFGASGSFASPYGFTGEQTDGNGQVYLRARYYNPSIGVFNALDPFEGSVGRPMSLNGYSWVEGNPIMNVDPSGMQSYGQEWLNRINQFTDWMRCNYLNNGACDSSFLSATPTGTPNPEVSVYFTVDKVGVESIRHKVETPQDFKNDVKRACNELCNPDHEDSISKVGGKNRLKTGICRQKGAEICDKLCNDEFFSENDEFGHSGVLKRWWEYFDDVHGLRETHGKAYEIVQGQLRQILEGTGNTDTDWASNLNRCQEQTVGARELDALARKWGSKPLPSQITIDAPLDLPLPQPDLGGVPTCPPDHITIFGGCISQTGAGVITFVAVGGGGMITLGTGGFVPSGFSFGFGGGGGGVFP